LNNKEKSSNAFKKIFKELRPFRKWLVSTTPSNKLYLLGWAALLSDFAILLPIFSLVIAMILIVKQRNCIWKTIKNHKNKLPEIKHENIVDFVFILFFVILYLLLVLKPFPDKVVLEILFPLSFSFFGFGVGIEIINLFKEYREDKKIRKILAVILPIISFASLIFSRFLINNFTGVNPSNFIASLSVFSVIIALVIWIVFAAALLCAFFFWNFALIYLYFFLLPYLPCKYQFIQSMNAFRSNNFYRLIFPRYRSNITLDIQNMKSRHLKRKSILKFVISSITHHFDGKLCSASNRSIGVFILVIYGAVSVDHLNLIRIKYQSEINKLLENIIVKLDYHAKSIECGNFKKGELVFTINDEKISIAKPIETGGYEFQSKKCDPK
jgi:hypothetical protein